jgi:hypothetical protein
VYIVKTCVNYPTVSNNRTRYDYQRVNSTEPYNGSKSFSKTEISTDKIIRNLYLKLII